MEYLCSSFSSQNWTHEHAHNWPSLLPQSEGHGRTDSVLLPQYKTLKWINLCRNLWHDLWPDLGLTTTIIQLENHNWSRGPSCGLFQIWLISETGIWYTDTLRSVMWNNSCWWLLWRRGYIKVLISALWNPFWMANANEQALQTLSTVCATWITGTNSIIVWDWSWQDCSQNISSVMHAIKWLFHGNLISSVFSSVCW